MIWYKFHLGDYITHTMHLPDAEDLAYRRLLDLYYMSEAPIPLDTQSVARKIRLDLDITESVLSEFFEKTDEGYRNRRCDAEIARYQHQVATNRATGSRGGRPKKNQVETELEPKANPNRSRIRIKTISSEPTRFDQFWATWPASKRKVGRAAVRQRWANQNLDAIADQIIAHVTEMRSSEQWTTGFEPAPMTYINQKRWEDATSASGESAGRKAI